MLRPPDLLTKSGATTPDTPWFGTGGAADCPRGAVASCAATGDLPPPGHSPPLAIWASAGNLCPMLAKYLQRGVHIASGEGGDSYPAADSCCTAS